MLGAKIALTGFSAAFLSVLVLNSFLAPAGHPIEMVFIAVLYLGIAAFFIGLLMAIWS